MSASPTVQHIEVRPNRAQQPRAFIVGTRIRVQDVSVQAEVHGLSADQIAGAFPHLTLAQVYAALSYYFDHREEIQEEIRQDRRFVESRQAQIGPGPLERKLQQSDDDEDSVSS